GRPPVAAPERIATANTHAGEPRTFGLPSRSRRWSGWRLHGEKSIAAQRRRTDEMLLQEDVALTQGMRPDSANGRPRLCHKRIGRVACGLLRDPSRPNRPVLWTWLLDRTTQSCGTTLR